MGPTVITPCRTIIVSYNWIVFFTIEGTTWMNKNNINNMWNSITTTIDKLWFARWAACDAKWWNRFGIALLSSVTYFNVLWWKSHPTQASLIWHLDWSFCHYHHTNESLRGRNSCTWLITIQLWNSLRWPIYVLNSVDNTKLPWRQ